MKKIFVGIPSGTGFPYPEVIFNIMQSKLPEGYELVFNANNIVVGEIVHRARNIIVQNFLDTDCDYLLMCDDDNPPSVDAIGHMIAADKDIVSALVPLRCGGNAMGITLNGVGLKSVVGLDSVFEIENFGGGMFMCKRDVILNVFKHTEGRPFIFTLADFVWNNELACLEVYKGQTNTDKYKAIDGKIVIKKGEIGEDLYFGNTLKSLGYKMYAARDARCIHYNRKPSFISIQNI